MIVIPPRSYCRIINPVLVNSAGAPLLDAYGQARLSYGDEEIRFERSPFPLYPGETLVGSVRPLRVIADLSALHIRCVRDYDARVAGDEFLIRGPCTYTPRVEEVEVAT